ncbi:MULTISPECIES: formaldehyde dehydrogenase, glutathione-independent [Pseudomonas]|jgi:glutathione-independent formaldehyde dehydrogenase|uniref:Glutathione-independent formaldehyde dehydrogenase n=1 Tax=Pseudomonas oryzihabitans TaxID=47885 RepID=A0A0U4WJT0_9PSED|nr:MULTISPECIES: formaldehyde dehydrogenase, glutathione-independent [Pseudomonas]ALZ82867.1 aldehyde dismutase [Pseudomonas oryzihabitans]WCE07624.1 formaldehyde dehydrogenase, glutathione-independent [Pseudomonas sp. JBR1]HAC67755.1 formaldehyde dehydrogenase, glutathione-independent [Pseudomonas sp.]
MSGNRGVVYLGAGKVEVQTIPYPKMETPQGKRIDHGVILRVVSTNICGSDQHMVRGRTTAPEGLVLGHEITGEVIEAGRDVETLKVGDLVSVPFNVACGRCRTCKEQDTGVCLTVNPSRAGGAYGYVDMGGWVGGQAEYVLVPYADFNLLRLPNRDAAMEKIRDLTCLSDILPTGYHGAVTAGVGPGTSVYVAGAGPVGLAAAASARLLGAAVVIVGDVNPVRLAHAKAQGFEIADLSQDTPLHEQIAALLGTPEVDCAVDAVGFEARGHGHEGAKSEAPATVLNSLMGVVRVAGKIGIPGLYVTDDPGAVDSAAKEGALSIRFGLGWAKSHSFHTGQTPVMKYNRQLMQAIMWDRIKIADIVGVQVITLDEAPRGYSEFDSGVPKKFVIDPHKLFSAA